MLTMLLLRIEFTLCLVKSQCVDQSKYYHKYYSVYFGPDTMECNIYWNLLDKYDLLDKIHNLDLLDTIYICIHGV